MDKAIEIKNLVKTYDNFTLGPLSLEIPKGCIVGYIGENGSGKSTTIKSILGLIHPDSGEVRVLGKKANDNPNIMNKIGVVFDELNIPGEMTVKEVGKFCRFSFETWKDEIFYSYMDKFKLPVDKKVKELSRGMKMKLGLSIALSHKAELLILDEATSGLDPVVRDEILDILLDFLQDETHTVFVSSHILSDLEKVADYIAFLHEGKLKFMEGKDQLVEEYALTSISNENIEDINPDAILGRRKHAFGQDLLVKRSLMPNGIQLEKPTIEDIMVYIIKGDNNESTTL